jgi:hypothetical protein
MNTSLISFLHRYRRLFSIVIKARFLNERLLMWLRQIPFATHRKSDAICDMKKAVKATRSPRHLNERF